MQLVVFLYEGYVTVMLKQSMQKLTSLVLIVVLSLLAFKSYAESVSSADFIFINGEFYRVMSNSHGLKLLLSKTV